MDVKWTIKSYFNMFKELRKMMSKELMESVRMMSHHTEKTMK